MFWLCYLHFLFPCLWRMVQICTVLHTTIYTLRGETLDRYYVVLFICLRALTALGRSRLIMIPISWGAGDRRTKHASFWLFTVCTLHNPFVGKRKLHNIASDVHRAEECVVRRKYGIPTFLVLESKSDHFLRRLVGKLSFQSSFTNLTAGLCGFSHSQRLCFFLQ